MMHINLILVGVVGSSLPKFLHVGLGRVLPRAVVGKMVLLLPMPVFGWDTGIQGVGGYQTATSLRPAAAVCHCHCQCRDGQGTIGNAEV